VRRLAQGAAALALTGALARAEADRDVERIAGRRDFQAALGDAAVIWSVLATLCELTDYRSGRRTALAAPAPGMNSEAKQTLLQLRAGVRGS